MVFLAFVLDEIKRFFGTTLVTCELFKNPKFLNNIFVFKKLGYLEASKNLHSCRKFVKNTNPESLRNLHNG